MKILIISPGYFPVTKQQGGAIEKLIDNFLEFNEKTAYSIDVYSTKNNKYSFDDDIYKNTKFKIIDNTKKYNKIVDFIFKVKNKLSFVFFKRTGINFFIFKVVKDFKKNKLQDYYDIIIFENGIEYINYFKRKTKIKSKIILHLHNDYLNIDTKFAGITLNNCHQVWTVSNYIKNRVNEIKYIEGKVKVLSNPLDVKVFDKKISMEELNNLRNLYKISKNDFVFIFTGRLISSKGVEELIKAFNNLNLKQSNIKLLVVGGSANYKNESPYIKKIKHIANDNVIFTGFVPATDLYKFYSLANAQVVPSLWNEAFGLILLEGMFFKLPIIATNSGGMPEICGNNAYYVSRKNIIENLEEKMEYVINHPNENTDKISNYLSILEKYTLENYCNTFFEYISNIDK